MTLKAALFDMDGTLLNTLEDLADSMNRVLARQGFAVHPTEAYKRFVGNGMDILVERALPPARRQEEVIRHCLALMREDYARHWEDKTRIYEGIPELLDELTRRRVPLAILSNKAHDFTLLMAERFLDRWGFATVLGARDTHPLKPDPAVALEIAAVLELAPEKILYVGDSDTDMYTARGAGMYGVGVSWGFRSSQELVESGAAEVVEQPQALLKFF